MTCSVSLYVGMAKMEAVLYTCIHVPCMHILLYSLAAIVKKTIGMPVNIV